MNPYNPVTPDIAQQLRTIVGEGYVIFDDPERLEPFSRDEVPDKSYRRMPEAVVRPGSAAEIAAIMKLANRQRIPVTPRGAGSGLSGGAVPAHGGIVLLTDRLNRILDIDPLNMTITLEPGVITNEINPAVRHLGLCYAGYPMSLETCFIGGNVAENAGGAKALKYGVTARYVLGLEIVTPTGDIVELGGKLIKDVTGYNLIGLMVGSEGTLAVFTKIILKLLPLPKASVDLLALFPTVDGAIAAVPRMLTESGLTPTSIEFIDGASAATACRYLNETFDYQNAGAMLLLTVDGPSHEQVQREYEAVGEACLRFGASEVYVGDNKTTSERLWRVRKTIPEAFAAMGEHQGNEDLVVPMAAIGQLVAGMKELERKYRVAIPAYGHAGDGNIHTRIVKSPDVPADRWRELIPNVLGELYELAARLGGRISGEHGIGHKRKKFMPMFVSPEYLTLCRAVKRALDPNNILNPGKIFDAE